MRICIVGAGAVGGLMATSLALSGNTVSIIDVGPQFRAIREKGLKLIWADGKVQTARVHAAETAREAGSQDLVILAVKANVLEQVSNDVDLMFTPETMVMTVQNGIPWWYFQRLGGRYDDLQLRSLDPSGTLRQKIDAKRIIGCVVYPAATVTEPGVVRHIEGDRFPIGELDGTETDRIKFVCDIFVKARLKSRILTDLRSETWLKAWGNLAFNPISALTHATLVDICCFPETRALTAAMMEEAKTVAEQLGVTIRHTIERRIQGAESVGAHKTSMLQDVEAGRPLEIEALIGSILEVAKLTGTSMPSTQAVYACVKLLNEVIIAKGQGVRLRAPPSVHVGQIELIA